MAESQKPSQGGKIASTPTAHGTSSLSTTQSSHYAIIYMFRTSHTLYGCHSVREMQLCSASHAHTSTSKDQKAAKVMKTQAVLSDADSSLILKKLTSTSPCMTNIGCNYMKMPWKPNTWQLKKTYAKRENTSKLRKHFDNIFATSKKESCKWIKHSQVQKLAQMTTRDT